MNVEYVTETLSDGSIAHNVVAASDVNSDNKRIIFGCIDADHAAELAHLLDNCAWIEAD